MSQRPVTFLSAIAIFALSAPQSSDAEEREGALPSAAPGLSSENENPRAVADSLYFEAHGLYAAGKYAAAVTKFLGAVAIRERVLGAEHPDVAQSCYNLALCLEAQAKGAKAKARKAEALSFARRALAIRTKTLGEEHPRTKAVLALVADLEKP